MMKRTAYLQEHAREIEKVAREIEKTASEIDNVVKEIEIQVAKEDDLERRAVKVFEELCGVHAQLANPALSEEEKAGLLNVQQHLGKELDAVRKKEEQLRKDKEQLRKDKEQLRKKEEQLRKEKEQLRDKEKDLRAEQAQSKAKAAGADPGRSRLQQQLEALPKPSDMAYSLQWSQTKNHAFFQCFRPTAGVGPTRALPVALYDLVLDKLVALFGAALKGVGGGGDDSSIGGIIGGIGSSSGGGGSSSGGGGAGSVPPSNEDCEMASRLCEAMAKSFASEAARMAAFSELLQGYLGERIEPHHPILGLGFETDGSLLCRAGGPASSTCLPVYIQEVKSEIGTQGDPYFQGQRYYQLYLADPARAALVRDTVLPVLFVELVGPYLRVSALASPANVTVVCEPLTPYLHLFSMLRHRPDHMVCVALVLRALKSGIGLLKNACGQLQQPINASSAAACSAWASAASALASSAGPAPGASSSSAASAGGETAAMEGPRVAVPLRDPSLQLPYPLRPEKGFRDVQPVGAGVYNPLYFAVYKDGAVAVKFARMSADAIRVHRAWAAAHLAPKVVLEELLPCGLVMLVMEQLAPKDGWVMFYSLPPSLKQQLNGAVVAALGRAHTIVVDADRGLPGVHADLRQANVMVRLPQADTAAGSGGGGRGAAGVGGEVAVGSGMGGSDGGGEDAAGGVGVSSSSEPQVQVRFVDFDWSGLQGHTRLPAFSRMRLQGYGCGCLVTQEYDRALWEHEQVHGPA